MTTCTRCESTGFLNLHQIPEAELSAMKGDLANKVPEWIKAQIKAQTESHDVQVCSNDEANRAPL